MGMPSTHWHLHAMWAREASTGSTAGPVGWWLVPASAQQLAALAGLRHQNSHSTRDTAFHHL
eukprot:161792-Chlamydomonas_euryale.AAC.1